MATTSEPYFASISIRWCKRQICKFVKCIVENNSLHFCCRSFFLDVCIGLIKSPPFIELYLLSCILMTKKNGNGKSAYSSLLGVSSWRVKSTSTIPSVPEVMSKMAQRCGHVSPNNANFSAPEVCIVEAIYPITLVLFCLSLSADLMCHVSNKNKMFCSWRQKKKKKHFLQGQPSDRGRPWLWSTIRLIDNSSIMKFSVSKKKLNVSDFMQMAHFGIHKTYLCNRFLELIWRRKILCTAVIWTEIINISGLVRWRVNNQKQFQTL